MIDPGDHEAARRESVEGLASMQSAGSPVAAPTPSGSTTTPPAGRRSVLVLALTGLAAGALLGWQARAPLYRSEALLYFAPLVPSTKQPAGSSALPMFNGFVALQVQLLESERVANVAVETEAWRKAGPPKDARATERFLAHRSIFHEPETLHVQVRFTDPSPGVALAGVRALLDAYTAVSAEARAEEEKLWYAATRADALSAQLKHVGGQMVKLEEPLVAHLDGKGRIRIADPGSLPTSPCTDTRSTDASLGGAGGIALAGLAGLVLRHRRRRGA